MIITNLSPIIVTKDAKALTELFEELGFEHCHRKEGVGGGKLDVYDMKHPDGFRVDIALTDGLPQALQSALSDIQNKGGTI